LLEFKESVYKTTKINTNEFDIELAVNWSTDSGLKAKQLLYDEDVEVMFSAVTKSIELYVGKVSKENLQDLWHLLSYVISIGIGYFTQMFVIGNSSASLVSPSYSNPYLNVGSHGPPPMYYGFMPTMMSQPPPE